MIDEPEIGSRRWYQVTPFHRARGTADTILRLLEQEEISRAKARELLAFAAAVGPAAEDGIAVPNDLPPAPWDRLNWCDDGDPLTVIDAEAERLDPGHLLRVNADMRLTIGLIAEWCRVHGADLCPGNKADTYGNGMRDAKLAVSRLLGYGGRTP